MNCYMCGGTEFIYDYTTGGNICKDCGALNYEQK